MAVLVNILTTYNGAGSKKALRELAMLEKQATLAGNGVAAGMFKASAGMQKAGAQMAKIGAGMTKAITLPVVAIGAVSVVMAAKFESSMKLIQTQAGGSAKDVKVLSAAVLELATKGQHGPQELSAALYHLKSVGMDNVTAMKALTQAEKLASVSHSDLEQTTNAVAAAYKSGIKGAQTFGQTVGTLNAIVGVGNLRMDDLVSAMGTGFLVNAEQWGVSLTSVGAALSTMTSRGIPATRAAMALKMAFAGMGAPSAVAEKAMAGLGLKSRDLAVAMREKGLGGALSILKDKLDGLSKTDQSIALTHMFGAKSSQAILTLLGHTKDYERAQKQVAANTSKFAELAAAQAKDADAKWAHFKSSMGSAAILIGNQLLPYGIRLADKLSAVSVWLTKLSPSTRKWVVGLALVAAAIGPVILIMGKLLTAGGQVIAVVSKLSLVLAANPIGLIVIAIVGLVAAFVILWKKCDWFRNFWIAVWDKVKAVAETVWPVIKAVGEKIVAALQWAWDKVSAAAIAFWGWAGPFITAYVTAWWTVIKTTFTLIVAVVQTAWDVIVAGVKWFWGWAGPYITVGIQLWWTVIKTTFEVIKTVVKTAWDWITAAVKWFWGWAGPFIKTAIGVWWENIKTTMNLIHAVFDRVWPLIVAVVKSAVANVKRIVGFIGDVVAVVRDVWDRIHTAAAPAWALIVGSVRTGISGIKTAVNVVKDVIEVIGNVWTKIHNAADTAWGKITDIVGGAFNRIKNFANSIIDVINWVIDKVPGMGSVGNVPTFQGTGGKGNSSLSTAPSGGRVSTPAIMDNGGMGGPVDTLGSGIGGALGSAAGWVGDLLSQFNIFDKLPKPVGGLFGGATNALLDMGKDAIIGLLKKYGLGDGEKIINFAKSMLGVPYLWGGTSPAGFDCSGLPYWSYMQAGRSIPRIPTNGGRQVSRGDVQPADIMFYYPGAIQNGQRVPFGHFKMYAGNNQTIESTTGGVQMRAADWGGAAQIRRYLAKGGYVPRTAGGLATVLGEGSEGEWVVPESKVGRFASAALAGSGGVYIAPGAVVVKIGDVNGASPAEVKSAARSGVEPALEALARAITAL